MNTILAYFLLIISAIVAIGGFIYSINDSVPIFSGEETSIRRILVNSLIFGISGMASIFALIMVAWFTDQSHDLTFQSLFTSCLLSMAVGVFAFFASLWRFFQIGLYRDWLFKKLNKK
jgi:hypothetical protein